MARRGAPKGNRYNVTHGLSLVRNQIKRRTDQNRSYVDRRTHEGQDALKIQAGLVEDQGGIDAISTAQFIAIQELTNLYYLALMMDRSTKKYLDKNPNLKNPKALSKLFSYRQPVTNNMEKYLSLLGLDRVAPPEEDLDSYLAKTYGNRDNGSEEKVPLSEPPTAVQGLGEQNGDDAKPSQGCEGLDAPPTADGTTEED